MPLPSSAVEVAQLPTQNEEDIDSDEDDSVVDFEDESDDISRSFSDEDEVLEIVDTTPLPHNGCRPPKKRRI